MLNIKRTDRVRNTDIFERVNKTSLCNVLYQRQLRALGHWIRRADSIVRTYALYKNSSGRNRRGRPRLTYRRRMEQLTEMTCNEMKDLAMDRNGWKLVVRRLDT